VTASDRAYKSFTAGGFQGALVTTHINKHIYLDTSYIPVEAPGDFGGPNLKKNVAHLWLGFTELGFKK